MSQSRQITSVADFNRDVFNKEAKRLLELFNEKWVFCNHLFVAQKSDEFWFKYDKAYYLMTPPDEHGVVSSLFSKEDKDLFNTITFESTYRRKHYFTKKDHETYDKFIDKLIPDDYFGSSL